MSAEQKPFFFDYCFLMDSPRRRLLGEVVGEVFVDDGYCFLNAAWRQISREASIEDIC